MEVTVVSEILVPLTVDVLTVTGQGYNCDGGHVLMSLSGRLFGGLNRRRRRLNLCTYFRVCQDTVGRVVGTRLW